MPISNTLVCIGRRRPGPTAAGRHHEGHRVGSRMRQGYAKARQSQLPCPLGRAPVKDEDRLAAPVRQHFHLAPPDPDDAGPERLGRRLLRREARRQLVHPVSIPVALPLGVDALQEALAEIVQRALDPGDLDDVGPDSGPALAIRIEYRGIPSIAVPFFKLRLAVVPPSFSRAHRFRPFGACAAPTGVGLATGTYRSWNRRYASANVPASIAARISSIWRTRNRTLWTLARRNPSTSSARKRG